MDSRPEKCSEAFIQHGIYLRNWSKTTVRTYRQGVTSLHAHIGEGLPTKPSAEQWVMSLRQRGLTPGGVNMYVRSVNSYLSWLHEEGHLPSPIKLKLLKCPQRQLTLLSPADIKAILTFNPRTYGMKRTRTLMLLRLDTGVRISEALGIERKRVDLDQMTVTVFGKGAKERMVPFSTELRKALFRWLQVAADSSLLFCTRTGTPVSHRTAYRDVSGVIQRVGITVHVHPHLFRHQFAASYVRRGGDIYRLSRLLGHTTIGTTQIYLRSLGICDLREGHERLTPLRLGA